MAHQRVVSIHSEPKEAEQEAEMHETEAVFYEYVFGRAKEDSALNTQECVTFEEAHQMQATTTSVIREAGSSPAAIVGRRLAELGDQIDAQYQEDMQEIVQLAGSPDSAFAMFHDVVKHLFEWDEQGGAQINLGRIAALLGYCYNLCKTYISQNMAAGSLVSFIAMVATWLFKFLIKAKFYDWLEKQGGWSQLLVAAIPNPFGGGKNVFLAIGVASLAIWAFSYFRGN